MANRFVHIELCTRNFEAAKTFYGELFNWKTQEMEMPQGPYLMIDVGEGTGGGMMPQTSPEAASAWLPYVEVEDIHAATERARSLGATITREVTAVDNMGWFSIITDPTGALLGLWKMKP